MPANIEVKVRVRDFRDVRRALRRLGARRVGLLRQRDTYFDVAGLRLKLREENGLAFLIPYRRPDRRGQRRSLYAVLPVSDPAFARSCWPVRTAVGKRRDLWTLGHTRVHLDRVADLGTFVELETLTPPGTRAECRRLLAALGLDGARPIAGSYADMRTAGVRARS